jgi:hypothetical protein
MSKQYHAEQRHNLTGKVTVWPDVLYDVSDFAKAVWEYYEAKDGYIAIGRLLFHEDHVELKDSGDWDYDPNDAIINLDDPQPSYGDFFWDYTYEMTADVNDTDTPNLA